MIHNKSVLLALVVSAYAMEMDSDSPRVEFHPVNPGSKTFHWILTLFILLIIPSISTIFAIANKLSWSLLLHFIAAGYSIFDTLFLRFPDGDNHENRTSRGTSWFLTVLLGVTVFIGTLINGTNLIINKFYPNYGGGNGEYGKMTKLYKSLSVIVVLTGWVRVCMAPVALFGFCYGRHTGQCIAHGIMGSAFIGYSFVLSLVLVVPWIRKHQLLSPNTPTQSQEFYDSTVMMVWGIVNTFTEHRWGEEDWSMGDYQHTSMGIIWWAGGLLGMFLSRKNKRSFIPGLLLIFTGYSMSAHSQHLMISTKVHAVFGIALMSAGVSRIVEISFLLAGKSCSLPNGEILQFQYFPSFCLCLAGILFMGATEEQLQLVHDLGSDHSAYILVVSSAAFMIFLWFQVLLWGYLKLVGYDEDGELATGIKYESIQDFEMDEIEDNETV
ncbi:Protein YTP1 [Spathaspora sp. JA1]|nr:Protein YTP1 [Spathaspora sp. JA1]